MNSPASLLRRLVTPQSKLDEQELRQKEDAAALQFKKDIEQDNYNKWLNHSQTKVFLNALEEIRQKKIEEASSNAVNHPASKQTEITTNLAQAETIKKVIQYARTNDSSQF